MDRIFNIVTLMELEISFLTDSEIIMKILRLKVYDNIVAFFLDRQTAFRSFRALDEEIRHVSKVGNTFI